MSFPAISGSSAEHVGPFQFVILVLSVLTLGAIAAETFLTMPHEVSRILQGIDLIACALFFIDFVIRFRAAESKLKFVYPSVRLGFARDVELKPGSSQTSTRIFLPVYGMFQGVTVGDAPAGCLTGVYRVRHPERFTLMPKVTLRPGWESFVDNCHLLPSAFDSEARAILSSVAAPDRPLECESAVRDTK